MLHLLRPKWNSCIISRPYVMRFLKTGASGGRVERVFLKVGPTRVTQVSFTTVLSTRLNVDMTCTLEIKRTDALSSLGDNSPSTIKKLITF